MLNVLLAALVIGGGTNGVPAKSPKSVGMSAERLRAIDRVIQRGVKAGGYPGAAVVVGRRGAAVWEKGFGKLDWVHASAVSPESTLYDIASLTKVVGTTTAMMVLFDEGKLSLDDHVSRYLPAFSGGWKDSVTLRQLLVHRSGLPAGRDIWRVAYDPQTARDIVLESDLVCKPGDCYIYSDLGADLLGMTVEAISGQPLDVFLNERVFTPLGMTSTMFRPADSLQARIAPTEITPPRGYPLRGEVHDENAYALGGVAGHAGLFSSAKDLAVFAQMMLNRGEWNGVRIVSDSAVEIFTHRADLGSRALGWDTCDGNGGCGSYLGSRAYGHTGFTGTSLWIDPDREMFVILLTNRVHAARARRPSQVISDVRADLADAAALAVVEGPFGMAGMSSAFRADRALGWNKPIRKSRSRYARRGRSTSRSYATGKRTTSTAAAKPVARKTSAARSPTTNVSKASVSKAKISKASVTKSSGAKSKTAKASSAAKTISAKTGTAKRSSSEGGSKSKSTRR